jgi:PEGA domain
MAEVRDRLTTYLHSISQTIPSSEALAHFMRSTFPPESRGAVSTTTSSPSLPIVAGDFTSPQSKRRGVAVMSSLGAIAVVALGVALWPSEKPVPVVVPPVVVAPLPPEPVDAGVELAAVEPVVEEDPEPLVALGEIDAGLPAKMTKKPVAVKGKGLLSLQTSPWSNVFFGKKNLGETPLSDVALPVGRHRLVLINDERKLKTTIEVEIKPNQTTRLKLKL